LLTYDYSSSIISGNRDDFIVNLTKYVAGMPFV